MTPTEKHRETAEKVVNDFRMIGDGCEGDLAEMIATALAKAEREASANLIGIIADIRQKSGVGAKPMLGDLADAIAARMEESRREGMKRAAEIARNHFDLRHADKARYASMAISSAILSEAGEEA